MDYYEFNITEYRALSFAKDTYNKDITIILDHIPEGCDYEMVLYDEEGNQVGIGKENGNGGLSITIPNWNSDNRGYTVKVQAKNGSTVNPDAEYHLSFQTTQADKSHGAYQEMAEVQKYEGTVRKQMQEGLTDTEETRAIKEIRQKYKAYYTEQMEKLHQKQAEDVMQGGAVPDDEQIHNLLEKKTAGGELTDIVWLKRSRDIIIWTGVILIRLQCLCILMTVHIRLFQCVPKLNVSIIHQIVMQY